jgi:aspartyl-tRNA(Asn)/glutamyl-tRNA(Gln) amidotransferase subunit B
MRADVNVSVRKPGGEFGTRCEIKNVNSIRFMGQAIEYEARRQIDISKMAARSIRKPGCSTRQRARPARCAPRKKRTTTAISPIPTCCRWSSMTPSSMKWADLPELPDDKKARFVKDIGLTPMTRSAVSEKAIADYFEEVAKGRDGKMAANWVINELFGRLNKEGKDIADSPVSAEQLGDHRHDQGDGTISGKIAKDVFEIVWTEGGDPASRSSKKRGMKQVTDTGAIEARRRGDRRQPGQGGQAKAKARSLPAGSSARS